MDQQRAHYLDPQIGEPRQDWKLAVDHALGKPIQDPGQNTGQETPRPPSERDQTEPDRFCRRPEHPRQHFSSIRSPSMGWREQSGLSPLATRLRKGFWQNWVELPLQSSSKIWLLPKMDPMGELYLHLGLVDHQVKWSRGERLPSRQIGEARLPPLAIPFHPGDGRSGAYAGRPPFRDRRPDPPGRKENQRPNFRQRHGAIPPGHAWKHGKNPKGPRHILQSLRSESQLEQNNRDLGQ